MLFQQVVFLNQFLIKKMKVCSMPRVDRGHVTQVRQSTGLDFLEYITAVSPGIN